MKSYSKTRGIVSIVIFAILFVLVIFTAANGWGYEHSGSLSDVKLGLDLRGGVSITYQAKGEETPDAQDMADTKMKLQKRVESYSTEAVVYQEGSNRLTIDIPGETDADAVLKELGTPGTLVFCTDYTDSCSSFTQERYDNIKI